MTTQHNALTSRTDLPLRTIAGRTCRVDTTPVGGDYPELQVTVYDDATGVVLATSCEAMGLDGQLSALEADVLANGW